MHHANSLDRRETQNIRTPSTCISASHPDSNCLIHIGHFYQTKRICQVLKLKLARFCNSTHFNCKQSVNSKNITCKMNSSCKQCFQMLLSCKCEFLTAKSPLLFAWSVSFISVFCDARSAKPHRLCKIHCTYMHATLVSNSYDSNSYVGTRFDSD